MLLLSCEGFLFPWLTFGLDRSETVQLNDQLHSLHVRIGLMVPVSEMKAAKAEASRLSETIGTLKRNNILLQEEIEKLTCSAQVHSTQKPPALNL